MKSIGASVPQRHWTIRWLLRIPPVRAFVELIYELGVNRIDTLASRIDKLDEGFKGLAENDCALLEAAIQQQRQNAEILRRLDELDAKLTTGRRDSEPPA